MKTIVYITKGSGHRHHNALVNGDSSQKQSDSLADTVFPDMNRLFSRYLRVGGIEKWVNCVAAFWYYEYIRGISEAFTNQYRKWCAKTGYPRSLALNSWRKSVMCAVSIATNP